MDETMEIIYSEEVHPDYGTIYVIKMHPNQWEEFKRLTPAIQYINVTEL